MTIYDDDKSESLSKILYTCLSVFSLVVFLGLTLKTTKETFIEVMP